MINARTDLYCIFGRPAKHSLSPVLHNAAFTACGINASYLAFEPSSIKDACASMRALPICGSSVTIPFKTEILPYLDTVDPLAVKIGAVNTVVNNDGVLAGYNTDGKGACNAIQAALGDIASLNVMVVGTGGSARAIAFTLLDMGAQVTIAGRGGRSHLDLASNLSLTFRNVGSVSLADLDIDHVSRFSLIVQTTPLGMKEDDLYPIDPSLLTKGQAVFDIVYRPHLTAFLKAAIEKECTVIYGIEMLIRQAAAQFELWTGREAPLNVMKNAVAEFLL